MGCDKKCRIIHQFPRYLAQMVNNSADFGAMTTTQVPADQQLRPLSRTPDPPNYSPRTPPGPVNNSFSSSLALADPPEQP